MEHIKRKIDKYFKNHPNDKSFIYKGIPYGSYCYEDIDNTCRIYCVHCGDKCALIGIKITDNIKICSINK